MKQPLVSIITPIYNCERYIDASFSSIENQTLEEFEWIIVNDGSTDGSCDLAHYFKNRVSNDKRQIVVVDNKDNKRIPTRRNQAVQMASGKYIAIHDGDDVSLPERLQTQLERLESDSSLFAIGGEAIKIDLEGKEMGEIMDYPPETHSEIIKLVTHKCMNPMIDPTTMFRKEDFLELGGYTLEKAIYTVPDFDLWLKAMRSGKKFANIKDPMIYYRTNPNGMTQEHKKEMIHAHMVVWSRHMEKRRSKNVKTSFFKMSEEYHMKKIKDLQEISI